MLLAFDRSFSAAVHALVDAVLLPSMAKSNFCLDCFYTFTRSPQYCPGSGPCFGSSQELINRWLLEPNGPSLIPYSSYWTLSSLLYCIYVHFKLEFIGLLISIYVPGPGFGALTFLFTGLVSLLLKAACTASSWMILFLISSFFFSCSYWPGPGFLENVYLVYGVSPSCFQNSPLFVLVKKLCGSYPINCPSVLFLKWSYDSFSIEWIVLYAPGPGGSDPSFLSLQLGTLD